MLLKENLQYVVEVGRCGEMYKSRLK